MNTLTGSDLAAFVLVHGGFVDGSGWEGVYEILKKDGYDVSIVQNATVNLADDVVATRKVIHAQKKPVVLVGHSYGGVVISEAGNDPLVAGLVYIAASAPRRVPLSLHVFLKKSRCPAISVSEVSAAQSHKWVHHVIALLDAAVGQLDHDQAVHGTILKAASLLRKQIDPEVAKASPDGKGSLRAWQARKVRAHIDSHIVGPVLVADLCVLVRLSEAHFSRAFRRTFGRSPHAFVIRRRVELAAQYMLQTEEPLSDIALRCGFTDQAHLCKHFRKITGHTPGAWRRAHSSEDDGDRHGGTPRFLQEHMQTEWHSAGGTPAPEAAWPQVA